MTFIKALLLYFLSLSQCLADDQAAMQAISAQLAQTTIITGDFSQQKNLKFLHKPLLSTGTFTYHKHKGLIWQTREPVMSSLLINDSRLISEHDTQAVPTIFAKTFKAILGGDFAALTDSFNISISDKSTGWQMLLTPKDEFLKKIITSISLSGDSDLTSLIIREASGNNSQIIFSNITHPNELTFEQQTNFARLSPP